MMVMKRLNLLNSQNKTLGKNNHIYLINRYILSFRKIKILLVSCQLLVKVSPFIRSCSFLLQNQIFQAVISSIARIKQLTYLHYSKHHDLGIHHHLGGTEFHGNQCLDNYSWSPLQSWHKYLHVNRASSDIHYHLQYTVYQCSQFLGVTTIMST